MPWDGFAWTDWAGLLSIALSFAFLRVAWRERPRA